MSLNNNYATNELKFWLQIMGDHALFIKESLNTDQVNLIKVTDNFIEIYDGLLEKIRKSSEIKDSIFNEATQSTLSFRDLKRELLAARLKNLSITSLPPTFYNHMLNELEAFLKVLANLETGETILGSILGQHLLWSLDAAGHAVSLESNLDVIEYKRRKIAKKFEQSFDYLYIKAVEIAGYFRSCPLSVQPVLEAYNFEMIDRVKEFMAYLEDLTSGVIQQKIMGRLSPLVPDHMYREECYYLNKIAESQPNTPVLYCDPGRPRVMG